MKLDNKKKIVVVVKAATMIVGGLACASVAGAVMKNIVPVDGLSKYNKAMITIGTALFGCMAADAGGDYAAGLVNAVEETFKTVEKMFKESDQEKVVEDPA